jgi:hypothetical protein
LTHIGIDATINVSEGRRALLYADPGLAERDLGKLRAKM